MPSPLEYLHNNRQKEDALSAILFLNTIELDVLPHQILLEKLSTLTHISIEISHETVSSFD